MKKKLYILVLISLFLKVSSCSGYKPIYGANNFNFNISEYSISGDIELGEKIYSRLYNLSQTNKKNSETTSINVLITASKTKKSTIKNSAGKILGYKINLNTNFVVKNFKAGDEILNESFSSNASYNVQDQFFETKKLEKKSIDALIEKTSQDFLIKLSENIL